MPSGKALDYYGPFICYGHNCLSMKSSHQTLEGAHNGDLYAVWTWFSSGLTASTASARWRRSDWPTDTTSILFSADQRSIKTPVVCIRNVRVQVYEMPTAL